MLASLSSLLPAARDARTLLFAGIVLGMGAAAQIAGVTWFLARGGAQRSPSVAEPLSVQPARETPALAVISPPLPTPVPPVIPVPPPPPVVEATPSPAATPKLAERLLPTPAPRILSNPNDLLEQAKVLRGRGDTQSALAKLREAQNATPDNPSVIAEMALTYEAMQLTERASSQWQRLYDMGESIGAPYYLAEARLHAGAAGASPDASNAEGADPTGSGRDRAGFQANAVLRILEAKIEEQQDPEAEKKLALRIVVKNRPGTAIDARKVKVETYFYDLVDGKDIVQTDAETGYRWLTAPVDWANDASEILEMTYRRLKGAPTPEPDNSLQGRMLLPPPPPASTRRNRSKNPPPQPPAETPPPAPSVRIYLGYVVRLYYNRQLQDVKADPERLLQSFPPPVTLPAD